ncbi:TraI/MobA(P) family conjugative relaxase [Janthinobacterium sp. CG3]|uniref:TraI/MobA(P) family conjugative relaxase n=1 Tax=Janthinobacterium sp. CG3 TaxID=1075768 RepID=UPI0003478568|nr:TraI/MobA(P) family conjugative relaxase [Janthinobacterium sp. CG3]
MIVKHIPMETVQKSDFGELVEYMTDPQNKNERVGTVTVTNCKSEQAEIAMLEVLNTQIQNKRSEADKTYHLMVSFRHGELPDDATLKAIEERICATLGFAEHQRISAVHHDTDNVHIHIAINKIHPTRYTINEPYNAYHTLAKLCEKLESDCGLEKDNHTPTKGRGENRAADMERHSDVESLLGWIKRECQDQIRSAQSWSSLHEVMRDHGLEIREHANGLIISAENGISVKASSVHREFSKKGLEGRLGSFTKSQAAAMGTPKKRYEKKPMRSKANTVELHARYKQAQQTATASRATEWSKAIARKNRLIEDAKRTGRLKRAAIKISGSPGIGKKVMYAATRKTLRDDIAAINKEYMKERQAIYEKYQRLAWADWLRKEATVGDQEALEALRSREASTGLRGNTVAGKGAQKAGAAPSQHDSITKRGTIIYKVGASAVRDDGDKLNVSRGADDAALLAALRMAAERYGNTITVNGAAAFKEQIARVAAAANLPINFADAALEARRQQLTQPHTTKENTHGSYSRNDKRQVRGRADRGRDGRAGQAAVRAAASRAASGAAGAAAAPSPGRRGYADSVKPDTGKAGQSPSPQARNAVRGLPELGVVHVAERGEMLLPRHVPGGVEQQGAKPNNWVRRDIRGPGRVKPVGAFQPVPAAKAHVGKPKIGKLGTAPPPASKDRLRPLSQLGAISIGDHGGAATPIPAPALLPAQPQAPRPEAGIRRDIFELDKKSPGDTAADKYIAEREQKRAKVFDIPKHIRYNFTNDATVLFGGLRQIDGQALALLKQGEEVIVLPVDDATARRLKRVTVGEQIGVTAKGAIKTKGRSR